MTVRVEYPGWGTWRVTGPGMPQLVVDPCVTPLLDESCADQEQVKADIVLLTHGHHEHIRDIHRLPYAKEVPIVAPPQVVDYLVTQRGMDRDRLRTINPSEEIEVMGLRIRAQGFPHLEKHDVAGKLEILRRDNPVGALALLVRFGPQILASWRAIRHQPEEGPYLAYDIRFPRGPRIVFTCEAFTELLSETTVQGWSEDETQQRVDLAILGVESGQEGFAAALLDALAPKRALAAAVHAPFERFYGKAPVCSDRFLSRTRVPTAWIRPGGSWSRSL